MKTKLLLIFFLITSAFISVNAQSSFGIFAEGGASKIKLIGFDEYAPSLTLTTRFVPSSKAGLYYNCIINSKFIFGAKLFIVHGGGKIDYTERYDVSSWVLGTIDYRVNGLGFNPYIGYKYKKLSLNVGMQVYRMYFNTSIDKGDFDDNGNLGPKEVFVWPRK